MAAIEAHWQLGCEKVEQRCVYLLTTGLWSDCTFVVGLGPTQEVIEAHKLVLAMASPVLEAQFFGALSKRNEPIVPITDIQPDTFKAMLQYIYTDNTDINSFDMACSLWYVAKKYILPHLETKCISYICSTVSPVTACQAYELAHFYEETTIVEKCIQIICTKTKEVLNSNSFLDVQLSTLIKVCSFGNLDVDSELDLFQAVARYAELDLKRLREESPSVEGEPPSKKVCKRSQSSKGEEKVTSRVESSSGTKAATELKSKPVPEKPSIRSALQKLRFLSLTAAQFAEGPALSGLLTKEESFAIIMNIASSHSPVAMPAGFSACRDRRQPHSEANKRSFERGGVDHTIHALKCGIPSKVRVAALAAADILHGTPVDIQPALDKGILDALIPALTEGDDACKEYAACGIYYLCYRGTAAQLRVLAEGAVLQPFCRLLAAAEDDICWVLRGLTCLLRKVEPHIKIDLLQRLQGLGVPQLLVPVQNSKAGDHRMLANNLARAYNDP